jgi:hypothetical protein
MPLGFIASSPRFLDQESELEWRLALPESRPLSWRSGRIPAWPYPPPRSCQYILVSLVHEKMFAPAGLGKV